MDLGLPKIIHLTGRNPFANVVMNTLSNTYQRSLRALCRLFSTSPNPNPSHIWDDISAHAPSVSIPKLYQTENHLALVALISSQKLSSHMTDAS